MYFLYDEVKKNCFFLKRRKNFLFYFISCCEYFVIMREVKSINFIVSFINSFEDILCF